MIKPTVEISATLESAWAMRVSVAWAAAAIVGKRPLTPGGKALLKYSRRKRSRVIEFCERLIHIRPFSKSIQLKSGVRFAVFRNCCCQEQPDSAYITALKWK